MSITRNRFQIGMELHSKTTICVLIVTDKAQLKIVGDRQNCNGQIN